MAENEPNRNDFKKERQTEETTREVKITEKQAQKWVPNLQSTI